MKEEKDYSMSMVFSAAALDSELSHLFYKWRRVADRQAGHDFDEGACEKALLKFGNFINKLNGVSELIYPNGGIEAFVRSSVEFTNELRRLPGLNSSSLANDFHATVFKPRNKILHQGIATFTEEDAKKSWNIAEIGLRILQAMDIKKRATVK